MKDKQEELDELSKNLADVINKKFFPELTVEGGEFEGTLFGGVPKFGDGGYIQSHNLEILGEVGEEEYTPPLDLPKAEQRIYLSGLAQWILAPIMSR